jgi:hypothetical protein
MLPPWQNQNFYRKCWQLPEKFGLPFAQGQTWPQLRDKFGRVFDDPSRENQSCGLK